MEIELYAKLHGFGENKSKAPEDAEFEKKLNEYVKSVIELEMKNVQPGLISSKQTSDKIKQEVTDGSREFNRSFRAGYKIIAEAMASEGLEMPRVDPERLKFFDDPVAFSEALEEGDQIYEILGFSFDDLILFQKIANGFFDKGEFQNARDVFFFLSTVSSKMAIFWNALGISYIQLQDFDKAEEALLNALELDPTYEDAYLNCAHVYLKTKKFEAANNVCDRGIAYAIESGDTSWAPNLQKLLTGVKEIIKQESTM